MRKKTITPYQKEKKKREALLKKRIKNIKEKTGIEIEVDTRHIMNDKEYYRYKSINVKNMYNMNMDLKYVSGISGVRIVFNHHGTAFKEPVFLKTKEAQERLRILQHYYKITGRKSQKLELPKNPKYYTRFKDKKEYEKWRSEVRSNAYKNLIENLKNSSLGDERFNLLLEVVDKYGEKIVDILNDDNTYEIFKVNVFDSDAEVEGSMATVWQSNAQRFYQKLLRIIPHANEYISTIQEINQGTKTQEDLEKIIQEIQNS